MYWLNFEKWSNAGGRWLTWNRVYWGHRWTPLCRLQRRYKPATMAEQAKNWQDTAKRHAEKEVYWRDRSEQAEAARDRYLADYEGACELVGKMHAAAVGEVRGPDMGPVEDVAALRGDRDRCHEYASKADGAILMGINALDPDADKKLWDPAEVLEWLRAAHKGLEVVA